MTINEDKHDKHQRIRNQYQRLYPSKFVTGTTPHIGYCIKKIREAQQKAEVKVK